MNPRLIVWIITHTINLELKQLKRNKLGIFLDCLYFFFEKNSHFRKLFFNTKRQRPFLHTFIGIINRNQNLKIIFEKRKTTQKTSHCNTLSKQESFPRIKGIASDLSEMAFLG